MEIDCPDHAIALWLRDEALVVRFPDRQLIEIPLAEVGRLVNILRCREQAHNRSLPLGIGTKAAPVQYDIDRVQEHLSREDEEARRATKAAKERAARMRRVERQDAAKRADEILELVGL